MSTVFLHHVVRRTMLLLWLGLAFHPVKAQSTVDLDELDLAIQKLTKKSRRSKTAGSIALGGGMAISMTAINLARTARTQDYIMVGSLGVISATSGILFLDASAKKHSALLLELERDLARTDSETEQQILFQKTAAYFKDRAVANRIPAITISGFGGLAILSVLTSSAGTQDPFPSVFIPVGLTLGAASIPFYIRTARHEKTKKSLQDGRLPARRFADVSPTVYTDGTVATIGFRLIF